MSAVKRIQALKERWWCLYCGKMSKNIPRKIVIGFDKEKEEDILSELGYYCDECDRKPKTTF